jgi:hypothetical protein
MPIQTVLLILIVFFAVFTQSLTGFGSGLIAMALLPELLGIQVAALLVQVFFAGQLSDEEVLKKF